MKDDRVDFIQCQRILQEIREDLVTYDPILIGGTSYDILSAIRIKHCNKRIDGDWEIAIDIFGVYDACVIIDEQHICDKDFVKFQIAGEIARTIEIVNICIDLVKKCIFPYQNKLVKDWGNKTKEVVEDE